MQRAVCHFPGTKNVSFSYIKYCFKNSAFIIIIIIIKNRIILVSNLILHYMGNNYGIRKMSTLAAKHLPAEEKETAKMY